MGCPVMRRCSGCGGRSGQWRCPCAATSRRPGTPSSHPPGSENGSGTVDLGIGQPLPVVRSTVLRVEFPRESSCGRFQNRVGLLEISHRSTQPRQLLTARPPTGPHHPCCRGPVTCSSAFFTGGDEPERAAAQNGCGDAGVPARAPCCWSSHADTVSSWCRQLSFVCSKRVTALRPSSCRAVVDQLTSRVSPQIWRVVRMCSAGLTTVDELQRWADVYGCAAALHSSELNLRQPSALQRSRQS